MLLESIAYVYDENCHGRDRGFEPRRALSAAQAQTYHAEEFTAKEQNYWRQERAVAGEWQGKLAEKFGLARGRGT